MKIMIIAAASHERLALFANVRQAVAVLPALVRTSGGAVFLYDLEGDALGITTAEMPRSASFQFQYRSAEDGEGTDGVLCRP